MTAFATTNDGFQHYYSGAVGLFVTLTELKSIHQFNFVVVSVINRQVAAYLIILVNYNFRYSSSNIISGKMFV